MPQRHVVFRPATEPSDSSQALLDRFDAVRREFELPESFPPEVLDEAQRAAGDAALPQRDETAVPFITIDPPTSKDLDQAMSIERDGSGYRVLYAIADVPAFVRAGGAIDAEARRRGQTVYCPDERVQLHPSELSEGAASLLPDAVRPAFVWDIRLAADGEGTAVEVHRAMVRSVRRYDYEQVQRAVDDGSAEECLMLLKEVGEKRVALERKRGGATLPMPEQEIEEDGQGGFHISFRPLLASEDWNAQISLLTGMGAADLMLRGKIGILRTMPPPDPRDLKRLRRQAAALGVPWAEGLDLWGVPAHARPREPPAPRAHPRGDHPLPRCGLHALRRRRARPAGACRGRQPVCPRHGSAASPRRPLRARGLRGAVVGPDVPAWAREALPTLPEIMATSDRRTNGVERACTDAVEAAELVPHLGRTLAAVVVDENDKGVVVQLVDLAVVAKAKGAAKAGDSVMVRVDVADVSKGTVELSVV